MPTIPTYIRSSDLAKYLEISSNGKGAWAEFIHKALSAYDEPVYHSPNIIGNPFPPSYTITSTSSDPLLEDLKLIKNPKEAKVLTTKILEKKADKASNLCEHFQAKGQCLVKGCKFGAN